MNGSQNNVKKLLRNTLLLRALNAYKFSISQTDIHKLNQLIATPVSDWRLKLMLRRMGMRLDNTIIRDINALNRRLHLLDLVINPRVRAILERDPYFHLSYSKARKIITKLNATVLHPVNDGLLSDYFEKLAININFDDLKAIKKENETLNHYPLLTKLNEKLTIMLNNFVAPKKATFNTSLNHFSDNLALPAVHDIYQHIDACLGLIHCQQLDNTDKAKLKLIVRGGFNNNQGENHFLNSLDLIYQDFSDLMAVYNDLKSQFSNDAVKYSAARDVVEDVDKLLNSERIKALFIYVHKARLLREWASEQPQDSANAAEEIKQQVSPKKFHSSFNLRRGDVSKGETRYFVPEIISGVAKAKRYLNSLANRAVATANNESSVANFAQPAENADKMLLDKSAENINTDSKQNAEEFKAAFREKIASLRQQLSASPFNDNELTELRASRELTFARMDYPELQTELANLEAKTNADIAAIIFQQSKQLFCQIPVTEFAQTKLKKAPHYVEFTGFFDRITYYVQHQVLRESQLNRRLIIVERWLLISKLLREQGDYSSSYAIFSALAKSNKMVRLTQTQACLPENAKRIIKESEAFFGKAGVSDIMTTHAEQLVGRAIPTLMLPRKTIILLHEHLDGQRDKFAKLQQKLARLQAQGIADRVDASVKEKVSQSYDEAARIFVAPTAQQPLLDLSNEKALFGDDYQPIEVKLSAEEIELTIQQYVKLGQDLAALAKSYQKNKARVDQTLEKLALAQTALKNIADDKQKISDNKPFAFQVTVESKDSSLDDHLLALSKQCEAKDAEDFTKGYGLQLLTQLQNHKLRWLLMETRQPLSVKQVVKLNKMITHPKSHWRAKHIFYDLGLRFDENIIKTINRCNHHCYFLNKIENNKLRELLLDGDLTCVRQVDSVIKEINATIGEVMDEAHYSRLVAKLGLVLTDEKLAQVRKENQRLHFHHDLQQRIAQFDLKRTSYELRRYMKLIVSESLTDFDALATERFKQLVRGEIKHKNIFGVVGNYYLNSAFELYQLVKDIKARHQELQQKLKVAPSEQIKLQLIALEKMIAKLDIKAVLDLHEKAQLVHRWANGNAQQARVAKSKISQLVKPKQFKDHYVHKEVGKRFGIMTRRARELVTADERALQYIRKLEFHNAKVAYHQLANNLFLQAEKAPQLIAEYSNILQQLKTQPTFSLAEKHSFIDLINEATSSADLAIIEKSFQQKTRHLSSLAMDIFQDLVNLRDSMQNDTQAFLALQTRFFANDLVAKRAMVDNDVFKYASLLTNICSAGLANSGRAANLDEEMHASIKRILEIQQILQSKQQSFQSTKAEQQPPLSLQEENTLARSTALPTQRQLTLSRLLMGAGATAMVIGSAGKLAPIAVPIIAKGFLMKEAAAGAIFAVGAGAQAKRNAKASAKAMRKFSVFEKYVAKRADSLEQSIEHRPRVSIVA